MSRTGPFVVGLTGGIGSGKSAVADRFAALGAAVIDTDAIAHELTAAGGATIEALRNEFGPRALTAQGALDRGFIRKLVFADAAARRRLEAILHPAIRAESERRCLAARAPYVILAVPLLIESGAYRERCDRICVVDCPVDVQVERVMRRSHLDEAQVRAIIAAQANRDTRLAAADDVIDNGGDIDALDAQIERLHERYSHAALTRTR